MIESLLLFIYILGVILDTYTVYYKLGMSFTFSVWMGIIWPINIIAYLIYKVIK